jgi:hypothetical protein
MEVLQANNEELRCALTKLLIQEQQACAFKQPNCCINRLTNIIVVLCKPV